VVEIEDELRIAALDGENARCPKIGLASHIQEHTLRKSPQQLRKSSNELGPIIQEKLEFRSDVTSCHFHSHFFLSYECCFSR
jgi:hypothetical protein